MGFLCGVYRWQQNLLVLRLWEDGGCIPIDTLIGKATLPCIAYWEQNHFVCYSGQPRQIPVVFSNSLCLKLLYRVFVSYSVCLSVPKRYAEVLRCKSLSSPAFVLLEGDIQCQCCIMGTFGSFSSLM